VTVDRSPLLLDRTEAAGKTIDAGLRGGSKRIDEAVGFPVRFRGGRVVYPQDQYVLAAGRYRDMTGYRCTHRRGLGSLV